jgi:hypothetical protein
MYPSWEKAAQEKEGAGGTMVRAGEKMATAGNAAVGKMQGRRREDSARGKPCHRNPVLYLPRPARMAWEARPRLEFVTVLESRG